MRLWAFVALFVLLAVRRAVTAVPSFRPPPADPLPLSHPRLGTPFVRRPYGLIAEQVHIALAGDGRIAVSWVTARGASLAPSGSRKLQHHSKGEDVVPSMVSNCAMDRVRSVVRYGQHSGNYRWTADGSHTCYERGSYKSGLLHTAVLGQCCSGNELKPGETYFYRVGDPALGWSREFQFTVPPTAGDTSKPLKMAVVGDLGQTAYSLQTLTHVEAVHPDLVLNLGDLSYADGDQARWDSWGRMVQPLLSRVPMMPVVGNHEIETSDDNKEGDYVPFQAYTLRYFVPYVSSGSDSNLYYSFDVGGVHFVSLGSYADYDAGSPQYRWLEADLKAVDRARTPWVVVGMHKPWYSSNHAHYLSGLKIAVILEPLLYEHGVDLVLQAHVHAYERADRILNNKLDACGPLYITIGDGGNRQGLDKHWEARPEWSVVREDSYGFATLEVVNATHMQWQWMRNEDNLQIAADFVWINKPLGCNRGSRQTFVT